MKEEIKENKYQIISLGHNCLPRTVLTRWGLKPRKTEGEKTLPFDLATFETFEITKNIKEDFKDFFNNLEYKQSKTLFKNKSYWIKAPDCIEFVHDKNINQNDKSKLIDLYKNRILNFKKALDKNTPILFVQLVGDCDDTENLYNALNDKRRGKPFKVLIIDPLGICGTKNKEIHILKIKYPNKYYQKYWWTKPFYLSKAGKEFERQIATKANLLLEEWK